MKVMCISKGDSKKTAEIESDPRFLTIGQTYYVCGIEIIAGKAFYYLAHSKDSFYPTLHSSSLFEVVTNNLSKYWQIQIEKDTIRLLFKEWLENPNFLEMFTNDLHPATNLHEFMFSFEHYQRLIVEEEEDI